MMFLKSSTPLLSKTLTGAFIFTADLVRAMQPPPPGLAVDFVRAASYAGTRATGAPALTLTASKVPFAGRHVILVEDIVDTGATAAALTAALTAGGAASVGVVALLDKRAGRTVSFEADHALFDCPDAFVVGYGLDHDEEHRCWPYVGVVD